MTEIKSQKEKGQYFATIREALICSLLVYVRVLTVVSVEPNVKRNPTDGYDLTGALSSIIFALSLSFCVSFSYIFSPSHRLESIDQ